MTLSNFSFAIFKKLSNYWFNFFPSLLIFSSIWFWKSDTFCYRSFIFSVFSFRFYWDWISCLSFSIVYVICLDLFERGVWCLESWWTDTLWLCYFRSTILSYTLMSFSLVRSLSSIFWNLISIFYIICWKKSQVIYCFCPIYPIYYYYCWGYGYYCMCIFNKLVCC